MRLGGEVAAECDPRFRLLKEALEVSVDRETGEELGLKGFVYLQVPSAIPRHGLTSSQIMNMAEEMAFDSAMRTGYSVSRWEPYFYRDDTRLRLKPVEYERVVDRNAENEEIRDQECDDWRRGK